MYNSEEYKKLAKRMRELYANPVMTVVERSGKSKPTVRKFFNKESMRFPNWEVIYDSCIELVKEQEQKINALFEKQHEVIPAKKSTKKK